jgi:hypothetical protein
MTACATSALSFTGQLLCNDFEIFSLKFKVAAGRAYYV